MTYSTRTRVFGQAPRLAALGPAARPPPGARAGLRAALADGLRPLEARVEAVY